MSICQGAKLEANKGAQLLAEVVEAAQALQGLYKCCWIQFVLTQFNRIYNSLHSSQLISICCLVS
jgi:hypothetical protein